MYRDMDGLIGSFILSAPSKLWITLGGAVMRRRMERTYLLYSVASD